MILVSIFIQIRIIMKNPFLEGAIINVFHQEKTETTFLHGKDGVNIPKSTITTSVEWEKSPYVKVYTENKVNSTYKNLSGTACKLLLYIQINLKKGVDHITLDVKEVMEWIGIDSRNTYYKYLIELHENAIITKRGNSDYWINPFYLFNGDRIAYYKENAPNSVQTLDIGKFNPIHKSGMNKKGLMVHFNCKSYYALKMLLGDKQINDVLDNKLELNDVKLLRANAFR